MKKIEAVYLGLKNYCFDCLDLEKKTFFSCFFVPLRKYGAAF